MFQVGRQGPLVAGRTIRVFLGVALLLVAVAGFWTALANRAEAGAIGIATVNSKSNTDDGQCNGPPNDNAVGNCTLREAINDVNDGFADTIKFHSAVFPQAAPGEIQLESIGGNLPIIMREVTIDNTGTGVILDCDVDNDQTWGCDYGLRVEASHNAFDFTLIGNNNFFIREINGRGISVDGGAFSVGDVAISGVDINVNDNETGSNGDDAIDVRATNLNNVSVTNSILFGDDDSDSDTGVRLLAYSNGAGELTNNNVAITNNRIFGGDGVDVDFFGDLFNNAGIGGVPHTINVDVYENELITGNSGDGVEIGYCRNEGGGCDARSSTINFEVTDNGKISSNDDNNDNGDAVRLTVEATEDSCVPTCNESVTANLTVEGNAIIDAADDDGVKVDIDICCATSDSTATVHVDGNSDIVGDDAGVEINGVVGNGPDNVAVVTVDDNGEITGEGDSGVDIDFHSGNPGGDVDSDENKLTVSVSGNNDIAGDDDDGIDIDATSGKRGGPGDADRNETTVDVNDNGNVDGDDDGIDINAYAGTEGGPGDSDNNMLIINVNGNGTVDGADDDGMEIDARAGHVQAGGPDNVTGDGNETHVTIDGNDLFHGHDGDGVFVDSFAGAVTETGEENHTNVDIINNGDLMGSQGGGDGVHIESAVCCDSDNENGGQTNFINISQNGDIIGQDADGIDIDELCCSVNTVMIQDNTGVIKGNADNGIEISPCLSSGDPNDSSDIDFGTDPSDDLPCMGDSVTVLTITGNNISNSGGDGILICCGAFQFPVNQAPAGISGPGLKSVIDDNVISHNGEDGVDLDTTIGINLSHNEIFLNGTSATDGDNGVEIDWQFGWFIAQASCVNGAPNPFCVKVPAHFNRISENSIYDNRGLGINLIGIQIDPVLIASPGSGTEVPGWGFVDGVGCNQFPTTPIAANDCIPYPKILFTGGVTVANLSGSACASCLVEVFIADDTPGDQTGPLARQHGEGRTYVTNVQADAAGNFDVELPCGMAAGILTATATDKLKNTSEFASNIPFPGTPACAAATEQPTDTPAPAEPTATPVPPTATSVPPTEEPQGLCGDVNSDGVVNALDAALILQLAAGYIDTLPKGNDAGDVNNDGTTNSIDAALILQSAAAMINTSGLTCP